MPAFSFFASQWGVSRPWAVQGMSWQHRLQHSVGHASVLRQRHVQGETQSSTSKYLFPGLLELQSQLNTLCTNQNRLELSCRSGRAGKCASSSTFLCTLGQLVSSPGRAFPSRNFMMGPRKSFQQEDHCRQYASAGHPGLHTASWHGNSPL